MIRTLLIVAIAALCYTPHRVSAQHLKLEKNQAIYYNWSNQVWLDDRPFLDQTQSMAFRVIERMDDGRYRLEGRLVHQRSEDGRGGTMDTADPEKIKTNNTFFLLPMALLNKPFTVLLHPDGKLDTIIGMQQLVDEQLQRWQIQENIQKQSANNLLAYSMFVRSCFPGREETQAQDEALPDITYWFNEQAGLLDSMVMQNQGMDTQLNGSPVSIRQQTHLVRVANQEVRPPLDTTWVNMLVESSNWSDMLKVNGSSDLDSAAVMLYRDRYGNRFATDQVYLQTMLRFYQTQEDREGYDALLRTTPNNLLALASTSHLYNKLQVLYRDQTDSAYAVIMLMEQEAPASLQDWIQQSFAQSFRPDGQQPATAEVTLLKRMEADRTLAADVVPMGQWVRAKGVASDATALRAIAHEQLAADTAGWFRGNPGRYNLLVYGLLRDAGQYGLADSLIHYTAARLKTVVDTTAAEGPASEDKFLAQHLLAHAFYLQYLDQRTANPDRALAYLGRAASYAPKSPNERAYGSFYDGVFLRSKPSYRFDYMEALVAAGRPQEAKQLLAMTFFSNPEQFGEIRKLHEQYFPDSAFIPFFENDLVGACPEAPAFVLNDLEEQSVSLAQYRGRWLVLDFWGTWCPPCVQEMPALDAFYRNEMTAGDLSGVALLAIACYDTPDKVRAFMAETGYAIPVALSDGAVQKAYNIQGYPTKVVISPTGKMMPFGFGADWKTTLAQLVELYPGG